jgi:hypothetical protein
MRFVGASVGLIILSSGLVRAAEEPKLLTKVTPLPVALSKDFQFRKTKLFFLSEQDSHGEAQKGSGATATKPGKLTGTAPSSKTSTVQDASITFERRYRLFGAVTALDKRQRVGDYLDFFWRAKRPADVTVRLEYRQEKLHSHVQAQEISLANVRGNRRTEFKVVGDDYFDDGRVIAWRCLLIENGAIVAENRSYLWE